MEPSWAELCPVSRCQMSDGMDGRDSYAEEEQASLDQVVLANTFFLQFAYRGARWVLVVCHIRQQMSVRMWKHPQEIVRKAADKSPHLLKLCFYI